MRPPAARITVPISFQFPRKKAYPKSAQNFYDLLLVAAHKQ